MRPFGVIARQGEQVTDPTTGAVVCTLTKDIRGGDSMTTHAFADWQIPDPPVEGTPIKACAWLRFIRPSGLGMLTIDLHLARGWMSATQAMTAGMRLPAPAAGRVLDAPGRP